MTEFTSLCSVPVFYIKFSFSFTAFQNGAASDAGKSVVKQTQKPQTKGLFSDDEDTQVRLSSLEKIHNSDIYVYFNYSLSLSLCRYLICIYIYVYKNVCLPQVFSTISKTQPKPEPTSQSKTSKAPLSLFDDEEEEVGKTMTSHT